MQHLEVVNNSTLTANIMAVQYNFNRYASSYNTHAIVQKEVANRLKNRLSIIYPSANTLLELGAGTGIFTKHLLSMYDSKNILATDFSHDSLALNPAIHTGIQDAHALTLSSSYDCTVSNLMMQWCDMALVCKQVRNVSHDGSLMLFSTFGPLTLTELKQSWANVDDYIHVHSFEDMHTLADTMSQNRFSGVVAESEIITLTYECVNDILKDIKYIGAQNTSPRPTTKAKLQQLSEYYEAFRINGKLPVTYEVIYIHGWIQKHEKNSNTSFIPIDNN